MKKATMCMVGLLMIVMLVGFGASAAAPGEEEPTLERGSFFSEEECEESCDSGWGTDWLVVGSRGGLYTDQGGSPPPVPPQACNCTCKCGGIA